MSSVTQGIMNSRKQDVKGSWGQEIKKPRAQDFSKDWFPDFKTSWGPDIKNSWGLEFLTSGAHESKSSWFWDIRGSWRLEIKTPRLQFVLISWYHYFMMDWVQDLFIPFQGCFVPDVGFGNGLFASLHWPENKRERDVIFDPFLSPRNMICFGTRQAVFSVTRNRFRNRKQLARKGKENSSEVVVFLPGPPWPDPKFNRRRFFKLSSPKIGCQGGKNCDFKEGKR